MTAPSPIPVAYLYDGKEVGGMETVLAAFFEHLDRDRYAPLLFSVEPASDNAFFARLARTGVPVASSIESNPGGLHKLQRALHFRRALARHRTRLLHVHSCVSTGHAPLLLAAASLRIPIVRTVHWPVEEGVRFRQGRALLPSFDPTWTLERALVKRVLTVSDVDRRDQVDKLGRHAEICRVVPNGIPLSAFVALPPRDEVLSSIGVDPGDFVVGAVGRLDPQKGMDALVRALPAIAAVIPRTRLVLVGDGIQRGELEALARSLGVEDRVRLLGHRTDVPAMLGAFDVLAFPSRYESHPLVLLEGLAAGCAVVASDIPSVRSALEDSGAALLFPVDDSAALAARVVALHDDPVRSAELREAARQRATAFPVERNVALTVAVYDEVLGGR